MANETDTGLIAFDPAAEAFAALAAQPFDPATLLEGPPPRPVIELEGAEALPYAVRPTVEVVRTFDPATLLGDAAKRGPATIGDGKPLMARIGGVEVVTIPLEHYAALLSPRTLPGVSVEADPVPDAGGMLDLLLTIYAGAPFATADLVRVTGFAEEELASLVAVRKAALEADAREVAPLDVTPSPEATTVDLPSGATEDVLTPGEVSATYDAAAQRGDAPGGPMDRAGLPAEPKGKGEAAYDAERGSHKRSRR